ncbi:MAG: hypothetical protein WBX01_04575 [Nitrososphaeraceae archaeon]
MVSVVLVASISAADNALASICPPMCAADIDEEEEAAAGNATTTMPGNQTTDENMTDGTNSTS